MTDSIKLSSKKPYIIGVSGGSGSGKTFFARALQKKMGDALCTIIYQDNFYFDQSRSFDFDGGSVNFDHPSSIDFELLSPPMVLAITCTVYVPEAGYLYVTLPEGTVANTPFP